VLPESQKEIFLKKMKARKERIIESKKRRSSTHS
jgi:hypothetical protein